MCIVGEMVLTGEEGQWLKLHQIQRRNSLFLSLIYSLKTVEDGNSLVIFYRQFQKFKDQEREEGRRKGEGERD